MGHELAGDIAKAGAKHQDKSQGMKFTLQPALNHKGKMWSPGILYELSRRRCTYCIIPAEVMKLGCLLRAGRGVLFHYEASLCRAR